MAPDTAAVYEDLLPAGRILDRTILHGMTWTAAVKIATVIVSWACMIIIARILSPQDYGIVTMGIVYFGLISMVTDFGLGPAIVALPDLSDQLAARLHTVASLGGLLAYVISCVIARPLSIFFKTPALAAVVVVLSTLLIFDGLRLVPTARLGRELRLKELAIFDGYRSFVSLIFSVPLALLGARYWTLVIGNVIAGLAITVLVLARVPQRFARFHFRDVKTTLSYSSHFLTNQLAWYGYTNADFVVAARTLGKIAVGEYTLAWSIISAPADKIMAVFGRVMPIVLSSVQRDADAVRRYFLLFTEALAVLIIPASVGLAVLARDFVLLVFGAKWAAAVLPLRLLAIYIAIHILGTPTDRLLQSTGQAAFPARCRFVMLVILPTAFYLAGRRWGTSGIAAMWVSVYPILLLPMYARVFRSVGIRVRDYLITLAPTLVSTAVMVAAVLLVRAAMLTIAPLSVRFITEVLAGAIAFTASAFCIQRRRLGILAEFIRTIRT